MSARAARTPVWGLSPRFQQGWGCPALGYVSPCALRLGRAVHRSAPTHSGDAGDTRASEGRRPAPREPRRAAVTPGAAVLLIGAVHAVRIGVAAPAHGDAVPVLALELVELAAGRAVFLQGMGEGQRSAGTAPAGAAALLAARTRLSARAVVGNTRTQSGRVPTAAAGQAEGTIPHPSHPHSRGPRRTSTGRRCSGRWHTRTRSPSRAGVLRTENTGRPLSAGGRRGRKVSLASSSGDRGRHGPCSRGTGDSGSASRAGGTAREGHGWHHLPAPFPSLSRAPRGGTAFSGGTAATQTRFWRLPSCTCPPHCSPAKAAAAPQLPATPAAAGGRKGSGAMARSGSAVPPVHPSQGMGTDPSQLHAPAGPAPAVGASSVRRRVAHSAAPSPGQCPRSVGAGGRSGHSAAAVRTAGEEGGRGCPDGAGRVKVGTDFGAKYKPCTGPGCGGSRVGPSLTAAPAEATAGADAQ